MADDKAGMVSPRKKLAMAGGSLKTDGYLASGAVHPDAKAKTGEKGAMSEAERGVGGVASRGGKELPGQLAPTHGSTHTSNVAFRR